jgi:hypothetical protein
MDRAEQDGVKPSPDAYGYFFDGPLKDGDTLSVHEFSAGDRRHRCTGPLGRCGAADCGLASYALDKSSVP